jgi:hypothetical protein
MIALMLVLPPLVLSVVPFLLLRRHGGGSAAEPDGHPESMTAQLAAGAEEYLAWLADHHWPDDEYLDLERGWRSELDLVDTSGVDVRPLCPSCGRRGSDVWPCHECGLLMHSTCGYGMRRRKIARPYRTRDMASEMVVAEWRCNRCAAVVGLDVDRGDERGRGLHQ